MTSLISYLFTFLAVIYWIFRAIVVLLYQLDISFVSVPANETYEIIILFLTLPCLIFVVKRNIIGAAAYLALYATYFGKSLYDALIAAQGTGLNIINSSDLLIILIGKIIPVVTFLDILFNRNRNLGSADKKSDWYYKNEAYDRKFDERADRNQYKF